ncbi:unnamed protein product [Musa acuminata var. zebrina]
MALERVPTDIRAQGSVVPWAVPPSARNYGFEWADPFGPIWVCQEPNCPQIKLMGSPLISNLIYMLTMIFLKTFTATCSGVSIASSGEASDELPTNIRRTFGNAPAYFRQTPRLATIRLASSDELLWQALGLLGFVPIEPPTTVRTSVELSNPQCDHGLNSGITPTACLTFIVVNPAHVNQTSI